MHPIDSVILHDLSFLALFISLDVAMAVVGWKLEIIYMMPYSRTPGIAQHVYKCGGHKNPKCIGKPCLPNEQYGYSRNELLKFAFGLSLSFSLSLAHLRPRPFGSKL